jgi:hypothetical protein
MLFSFTNVGVPNIYLWNGHVAPWILILAVGCIVLGLKKINTLKVKS